MKVKKYNIIYSLGTDCSCATYMKMANLRSRSGPFDWLTHASFKTRMNLILNDFEDFLNKEDLVFLEKDSNIENDNNCDYYHNIHTDFYFYHDFEYGKSLDDTFENVKEKYNRRINRFYQEIAKNNKVLLIWFAHNWNTSDEEVLDLCQKICKKFNKALDFLIIEHSEEISLSKVKKIELTPNITRYFLCTKMLDANGNLTTLGRVEDCLPLFQECALLVPLETKVKKKCLKLFINLIPIKPLRKSLRKKYL